MQQVLIVIHLIVVVALVGVILLQRSDSGALGIGGGSSGGFMTGRGQANALTRMTAILATIFFITSIILAILAGATRQPKSIFDTTAPVIAPANPAAPPSGGVLDQLKQLENQSAPK
jgi:preprotein translocase subunit SecG